MAPLAWPSLAKPAPARFASRCRLPPYPVQGCQAAQEGQAHASQAARGSARGRLWRALSGGLLLSRHGPCLAGMAPGVHAGKCSQGLIAQLTGPSLQGPCPSPSFLLSCSGPSMRTFQQGALGPAAPLSAACPCAAADFCRRRAQGLGSRHRCAARGCAGTANRDRGRGVGQGVARHASGGTAAASQPVAPRALGCHAPAFLQRLWGGATAGASRCPSTLCWALTRRCSCSTSRTRCLAGVGLVKVFLGGGGDRGGCWACGEPRLSLIMLCAS